jgi:CheY-like chemotaxis protein
MPALNGFETIRIVREKLGMSAEVLPVILLHSSAVDAEIHHKCQEYGIDYTMTKPVHRDQLLKSLLDIEKGISSEKPHSEHVEKRGEPAEEALINQPCKVLIAEDNRSNMQLVTILLKRLVPKAEIIEAENGVKALDQIHTHQPDLVLMDVQMPKLDGNQATSELRKKEAIEKLPRTPVVGLTAGALEKEKENSMKSGMDDFLTKPIVINNFKKILMKYLNDL